MTRRWIAVCAALGLCGAASATVLNFDDITVGNNAMTTMPAGYGGFTWGDNWYVITNDYFHGWGSTYNFPTLSNAAFNGYGSSTITVTRSTNFDFIGADITQWSENNKQWSESSPTVTFTGYRGGVQVGSITESNPADSFLWASVGFTNVDTVTVSNDSQVGGFWIMDNFTYGDASVPGPIAAIPFLAGLVLLRRRRR